MLSFALENIKKVVKKKPSQSRCVEMIIGSSCTGVRSCFYFFMCRTSGSQQARASLGEGRVVHNPLLFLSCLAQLSFLHFMSYNLYFLF